MEKNPFQFLQFFYINRGDRTSHWVGHSKLKESDKNDLFEIKQIIEDMESELTEAFQKLQKLTIQRWLKRKMLTKPSLQKPRLTEIRKFILNKNKIHRNIKNNEH